MKILKLYPTNINNCYLSSIPSFTAVENTTNNEIKSTNKKNKKFDNKDIIKYSVMAIGAIIAIWAGAKGIKKLASNRDAETIIDETGKRVTKESFRGAAVKRADEVPGIAKLWTEIESLGERIDAKFFNGKHLDIDYYKDVFRLNFTIPAEKLKALREVKKPEKFSDVFDFCRLYFQTDDGLLIYGKKAGEKKKLLDYFIQQAKAYGIDVKRVSTQGVTKNKQISSRLIKAFDDAKKRFNELKRHTLLVIEDVDFILKKDGPEVRAIWNEKALSSHKNGVITLTTAKDLNALDESCTRSGRITYKINIDDALVKQAETDKLQKK